jgi:hypothetical protein
VPEVTPQPAEQQSQQLFATQPENLAVLPGPEATRETSNLSSSSQPQPSYSTTRHFLDDLAQKYKKNAEELSKRPAKATGAQLKKSSPGAAHRHKDKNHLAMANQTAVSR